MASRTEKSAKAKKGGSPPKKLKIGGTIAGGSRTMKAGVRRASANMPSKAKSKVPVKDQSMNKATTNKGKKMVVATKTSDSGAKKAAPSKVLSAEEKLEASAKFLFDSFARGEEDSTYMSMEGISQLCSAIGVDAIEDIRVLVFLWKLGAFEKPGHISKDEWTKGCIANGVDSVEKVKTLLLSLELSSLEQEQFRGVYQFAFRFNLEGTRKTLDKELVLLLWPLILKGRVDERRLSTWIEFLDQNTVDSYSKITLDQWTSFLRFCYEVKNVETDYNEEHSAWPVIIDEYVEYLLEREHKK